MNINNRIEEIYKELVNIRRDFHMHPELGFEEFRTQEKIIEDLKSYGIENIQKIAKTGVMAIIEGSKSGIGNVVALRADIDALPITEEFDSDYKSQNDGKMHACGHDVHTTILLGAAKILNEMKYQFAGSVKLLFQPAEETTGGAMPMIEEGCLENPSVDYALGLHVMPYYDYGHIEFKYDKLNASSDNVEIIIHGKSGHGAYPETSVDAIVISSYVIGALQSIVSRNISPLNSAVLSFGTISGGTKENIISDKVTIVGTLRTLDSETRSFMKTKIIDIVENTSKAFGGVGEVNIHPGYEPLINDNELIDVLIQTANEELEEDKIHMKEFPSLGAEDFSYFSNRVKGAFYHLGCGNKELSMTASLHNSNFAVDERCIKTGVLMQVKNTLKLLQK